MIIGLLNQKGGVGKTTLSVNLAGAFVEQGYNVLLVDADPQGSSLSWSAVRESASLFPVVKMDKPTLHKDLPKLAASYDITIIDGAPRVNELARSAIMASDLIVIPVQPSPVDVWATDDIVALIKDASVYRENLKTVFAVNRKISNTAIGRDVHHAFADQEYPVLPETICQRVIFAESFTQGLTVLETDPNCIAAEEIRKLASALINSAQE
ncbi:MAG: ParA family partition ATPase [Methyloligellaceae bacterium]